MRRILMIAWFLLLAGAGGLSGAEYFVVVHGDDGNSGLTVQEAFATVQRGVDALAPGDTLTVMPGEYLGNVRRADLGSDEVVTTIRARIPGTALLRGDVPAPAFRRVENHRWVYEADFAFAGEVPAVNELDTLVILERMPNAAELDFAPATFHYDPRAGKLYIATSDMKSADAHRYGVQVVSGHGFYLSNPRRVVVEGLAATGFNSARELNWREGSMGSVWGFFLFNAAGCVIRDCHAWLNGRGIGVHSQAEGSGGNVIERCAAWSNASQFTTGDSGGLTILNARRDIIRDSVSFLNGDYGINIYAGATGRPGIDEENKSFFLDNLAWGNWCDFKIKTGYDYVHAAERNVGLGLWILNNPSHCLMVDFGRNHSPDNIVLAEEEGLDPGAEFADPDNHDYRLQADSRFRGTAPGGGDRGPFPYRENIFYLAPGGDDAADGLTTARAWRTLGRALPALRPGDTLYLEAGEYRADGNFSAAGSEVEPVSVRGRGAGPVVISGDLRLAGSRHLEFRRLAFAGDVRVERGGGIAFDNCWFGGPRVALAAVGTAGLAVCQSVFTGFRGAAIALAAGTTGVRLAGNIFDNRGVPALRLEQAGSVEYSDYNAYQDPAAAWDLAGEQLALAALGGGHDRYSQAAAPPEFAAAGPLGRPAGNHRYKVRRAQLALAEGPRAHSVGVTSANLEWTTSLPAACAIAWGETPECENSAAIEVNYFGSYSLTGLTPGRIYYFRVKSLSVPQKKAAMISAPPVELAGGVISFTTLDRDPAPTVYFVAPDGDDGRTGLSRENAWRTIQHAADHAGAGDTVMIAGGTYRERVRVRATGEEGRPLTFRSLPGEKVVMDGVQKSLRGAFIAAAKSHLRFDGLYFTEFNFFPGETTEWMPGLASEFSFYQGRDIRVTRCFSDGRSGYTARFVTAMETADLAIENCVTMNKMSGSLLIFNCPGVRLENCVIARPLIQSYHLWNRPNQPGTLKNNIFTDCIEPKAKINTNLLEFSANVENENNCIFLRLPSDVRQVAGGKTIHEIDENLVRNPLLADPGFAGDPGVRGNPADKSGFSAERLMTPALPLDFDSFFATNPEVVRRGIGLQPEAFAEFNLPRAK